MYMAHAMHGSYANHVNAQLHALACGHVPNDVSFYRVTCNPIDDRIARIDLVDGTRAYRPQTLNSNATPVLIIPEQVIVLELPVSQRKAKHLLCLDKKRAKRSSLGLAPELLHPPGAPHPRARETKPTGDHA